MLDQVSLNLLDKTHFSGHESRVYLAILQLGTAPVTEIARVAGLKRPTAYAVLQDLHKNGYIQPLPGFKVLHYTAVDPTILSAELETASRDFKEMLPYLRSQQRKAGKPHVTYFNGSEGARKAYAQIQRPKNVRYATSIHKVVGHVPDEVERWKKIYTQGKARPGGLHLLTDTEVDRAYGKVLDGAQQVVKYLDEGQKLDMDLALFDDTVILTAFDTDIHVTVIESEALCRSLTTLYDLAWSSAKQ